MLKLKNLLLLLCLTLISGCMALNMKKYKDETPKFNLQEYFSGNLKAWGIVQDWRGNVVTRFDADMKGVWTGNKGVLEEEFRYYNGKVQSRTWRITKQDDENYIGFADDIIDKAIGETLGSAARWQYVMDVPVDDSVYRIKFDDWMWQMHDGVVINRSYMKKFGITVAELTIFIKKSQD